MWNGKRIADRRRSLSISQEELADLVGTNQKQISRYERGENIPTGDVLAAMARALDTTADWLLGLTSEPTRPLRSSGDLDDDELQLIEIYRRTSPDKRKQVIEVARVLAS